MTQNLEAIKIKIDKFNICLKGLKAEGKVFLHITRLFPPKNNSALINQ